MATQPQPNARLLPSQRKLDEAVVRVREAAPAFARLALADRIALARSMRAGYLRIAERSVRAACAAKGIRLGTPAEGEEWGTGPWCVVRQLRLLIESLCSLERNGNTPIGAMRPTADGRVAVRVFPANAIDGMLFSGITVDVRMRAGVDEAAVRDTRASFYKRPTHAGRTVLVLGAGNLAAIPAMDVLTKLFNEGKVCVLKMNPVNAYLAPFIEEAFVDAIAAGYLAVVYGGTDEGGYLAHHPGIDEVHLTGSDKTYDAIVWGPPCPERDARKACGAPVLAKPVTAELGNVSPVLVMPWNYSEKELAFQAESIAGAVTHNASFNCNAAKMLVLPKGWSRRGELLAGIERALAAAPLRQAYYPGAADRWRALTGGRSEVRTIGAAAEGALPWTLLPGLDASNASEPAFSTEPFCAILSETSVGSDDPIEFLERAVTFANDRLWGTLAADLVVHPKALKDPRLSEAVERGIARLRYGAVTVNSWSGFVFACGTPPWGAFPGSTPADIQSGTGWAHNTPMLEGIEKAVLRHPITLMPKPATFPSHRTAHALLRRITYLDEQAKWSKVPGVVAAAMRG
ncbi:MAG TPA: aldehyde dehydrogenase family protein [Gemmatimonadales bacterium]|nr:aldehyde dehydrogenase family protein [Gemmatimonadales bacterium]